MGWEWDSGMVIQWMGINRDLGDVARMGWMIEDGRWEWDVVKTSCTDKSRWGQRRWYWRRCEEEMILIWYVWTIKIKDGWGIIIDEYDDDRW